MHACRTLLSMRLLNVLRSEIDASVNFVRRAPSVGFFESRYVRRCDQYFICYLSSQSGCNRGCRFCHLTTTGQTTSIDARRQCFVLQAESVLEHYEASSQPARYVHFNFMARGEPLANVNMIDDADSIMGSLGEAARARGLPSLFNVSTIMPLTLRRSLIDVFKYVHPTIYYSLYSIDDSFNGFRHSWMPGAMSVEPALELLREYQEFSRTTIKVHYAFIAGQNDDVTSVNDVCAALNEKLPGCTLNVVRYNPPDENSRESDDRTIERNVSIIKDRLISGCVNVIPRVGTDVHASCGTFFVSEE